MGLLPEEAKVLPPPGIVNRNSVWCGIMGWCTAMVQNALNRRPPLKSGVHRQALFISVGWFLGYHLTKYESYTYARLDRDMRQYISQHPSDFQEKESITLGAYWLQLFAYLKDQPGRDMGNHGSSLDDILAEDMHHWYNKFMRESPSGQITLFELKTMLGLQAMNEDASGYVDQVFCTFDMDGDGYIDFVEYIAAVSLLLKGEINQKLKWYFKLFDQDGNGKIDKDELETIFTAIQDITRKHDVPPEEIVSLIFQKIDANGEGELTLEEFISGAKEHSDIMEMLKKMMDLTPVLEIIVNGRLEKM